MLAISWNKLYYFLPAKVNIQYLNLTDTKDEVVNECISSLNKK